MTARYVVGFDLGTTNSAVSYVDTDEDPWRVRTFAVPQLVAPAQIEARETLPSFLYQPAAGEMPAEAIRLPWQSQPPSHIVGTLARDHGTLVPGRMIASAKSWLCHSGVDRMAPVLPWHGAADAELLSPVDASARLLEHVRGAWDARFTQHPLAEQDLVLTLPASFDEVARELTVKAAARAGLPRVVLIEEPQAAFYAWIYAHAEDWHERVEPGQKILVCDVGGGTSDFTLIRVRAGQGGKVRFHRVAVGSHLILGGDNLDLALAQHVEQRLAGQGKLEPRQWAVVVNICRQAKETLLGNDAPEQLTINVPGSGSSLVGGSLQVELTRQEARSLLLDGFFPEVRLDDKPAERRSGFQEFGLPYTPDPAVTRYLAAFLTAHRHVALDDDEGDKGVGSLCSEQPGEGFAQKTPDPFIIVGQHDPARPDVVLFNGGLFASGDIRRRVLEVLKSWFRTADDSQWEPHVLANERLDLAVARGAAYYGMVRRGQGVRIAAGLARTYYIGVETETKTEPCNVEEPFSPAACGGGAPGTSAGAKQPLVRDAEPHKAETTNEREQPAVPVAMCLVPAGVEPGQDVDLTQRAFNLLVSQPVEFPLFVSSTRLTDRPGELVAIDREQMTPLPPVRTVLHTRKKSDSEAISVNLHARLTEIGTLDVWCSQVQERGSWRLQFDIRSATETDREAHEGTGEREGFVDESIWSQFQALILATFGPGGEDKPEGLAKRLTRAGGMNRKLWPMSLLRRIWETLLEVEPGRRRSPTHEARWLNLLGFALRPGYGLALDDWRVDETWKTLWGKLIHDATICRAEWWVLWRRIAGGLAAGQQHALADPLVALVRDLHRQTIGGKPSSGRGGFGLGSHEAAEVLQLVGSLELLPPGAKIELGGMLLDLLPRRKIKPLRPAIGWALGRIGARQPVYGPFNSVVPADVVSKWLGRLLEAADGEPIWQLAMMQMARHTSDRYRDLSDKQRGRVVAWLETEDAPAHFVELVREGGQLDAEEQGLVFGEALPKGLRIL